MLMAVAAPKWRDYCFEIGVMDQEMEGGKIKTIREVVGKHHRAIWAVQLPLVL